MKILTIIAVIFIAFFMFFLGVTLATSHCEDKLIQYKKEWERKHYDK